jgi:5-methylcytosine-specific restriction endonuclease McrA
MIKIIVPYHLRAWLRMIGNRLYLRLYYYHSAHWKQIAAEKRRRAGYKCEICRVHSRLDVHHRHYKTLGHESMGDLLAVCRECHKYIHRKK